MITGTYEPSRYTISTTRSDFPINFEFSKSDHIKATVTSVDGVDTVIEGPASFSISGTTLTTTDPMSTAGEKITIWLDMPFTQGTDYKNTGTLNLEDIEDNVDELSLGLQQLQEAQSRALVSTVSSEGNSVELPTPEALKFIRYKGDISGFENVTLVGLGAVPEEDVYPGFHIDRYGAIGDGVTDDSAAIQLAVDAMKAQKYRTEGDTVDTVNNSAYASKIVFTPGKAYVIETPIDMTGIRLAHSWWHVEMRGAVVYGRCTGKAIFDLLGSRKCVWDGGTIIGETGFVCRVGIQIGRDINGTSCDGHHFKDVEVKGDFTLAPVYNYGSETVHWDCLNTKNDYLAAEAWGIVLDGSNYWGITSDFVTVAATGTASSFLLNRFTSPDIRRGAGGGSAVWIADSKRFTFENAYFVSTDRACVTWFSGNGLGNKGMVLDVHSETDSGDTDPSTGVDNLIYFDSDTATTDIEVYDLTFINQVNHSQEHVFAKGTNVDTVSFFGAEVNAGTVNRDVGQDLFDTPAEYYFQGRLTTFDATGNIDIVGMGGFSGKFITLNASTHGQDDNIDVTLVDDSGEYKKDSLNVMANTTGEADVTIVDTDKTILGRLRFPWNFIIGTTSIMKLFSTALFPNTTGVTDLGQLLKHWAIGYIDTLYFGENTTDTTRTGLTSTTSATPEGSVVMNPGSICTTTAGKFFFKVTGTGATGWVEK